MTSFFFLTSHIFSVLSNVPDVIFHLMRSLTTCHMPSSPVILEAVPVPGQKRHLFIFLVAHLWIQARSPRRRAEAESRCWGLIPRGRSGPRDVLAVLMLWGSSPLDVPWIARREGHSLSVPCRGLRAGNRHQQRLQRAPGLLCWEHIAPFLWK